MADKMAMDETGMDSLYGEDSGGDKGGGSPPDSIDQEEQQDMASSAIVPLKVLTGKDGKPPKEGDEIVVKVGKIYNDDEAEIRYAPAKGGGSEDEGMSADEEIDSMDKGDGY